MGYPCPDLVGGTGGTPSLARRVPLLGGTPVLTCLGCPQGTPRKDMGPVEVLCDGDEVPPGKDMGPVEVLWNGDEVPPGVN